MCLLSQRALVHFGFDTNRGLNTYFGFIVTTIWLFCNPIPYLCIFLYLSTEIGKIVTLLCLLCMQDYRRFLAHLEYRMDQQGGEVDDNSVELSLQALQSDVRFVRCPLCRRLSSS